jgi:hypothetical protein
MRVKTEFSVAAMTDRWLAVFPKTFPAVEWPSRWKIKPLLPARHPVYYSAPLRVIRRLVNKIRH